MWAESNYKWCTVCNSKVFGESCDKCDDVAEQMFEDLKSELSKLDIGSIWRFIGISDGENMVPAITEMRSVLGSLKDLNEEISGLKYVAKRRGHNLEG